MNCDGSGPYLYPPNHCRIKNLFANISLVVFLNLLIKPAWLLTENLVQNAVGHGDWGIYSALYSLGFLFLAVADLGINQFTTKTLASEPEKATTHFPNLLTTKGILTTIYPFVMIGLGWMLGYRGRELYFLATLSLIHGVLQISAFFRANYQAMQRFKTDGLLSVADRIVSLILVGFLFLTQVDISRFIHARLIGTVLTMVIFYVAISQVYGWLKPRFQWPMIKKLLKLSLPFAMVSILYSVHDKVDQVMLERLYSKEETGLYVGAYRWLDAFTMYLWTVLPIFFARFAYFIKDNTEKEKLLHFGQVICALPLIFVSVWVFFHGKNLLFLFSDSTDAQLTTMFSCLQILFIAAFLNSFFAIFSTFLTSTGYEKIINRIVAVSIGLNIILNFIFIPKYGAIASAWTTVLSYAFMDIAYLLYLEWYVPIRVPYGQMARILLASGILALAFWSLGLTVLPWYLISAIAGLIFLGAAFALRLISREVFSVLRRKS